jgi:hypothetical protein
LLLRDAQGTRFLLEVELNAKRFEQLACLCIKLAPVYSPPCGQRLAADKNILCHIQIGKETELLINSRNSRLT